MTFETYYSAMKNHGIGKLLFSYGDWKECYILMYIVNYRLKYEIIIGEQAYEFESFDELVSATLFNSFTIKEIWSEIHIISLDDVSELQYDLKIHSIDYIQFIKDLGDIQWEYRISKKDALLSHLKYIIIFPIILLVIGFVLALTNMASWYILLLFGGVDVISLVVQISIFIKTYFGFYYIITNKTVIIILNSSVEIKYEDIIKVKLRHSFIKKNRGTIKIVVKKRHLKTYKIAKINDVDKIFNLIYNNIAEKKN